jgi:hypothetical protein
VCPADAIKQSDGENKKIAVLEENCFECGLCRRLGICPTDAFTESEGTDRFPRLVRALFSDPNTTHKCTMIPGRGTEESKTNDVTGRVKLGQFGICIEFGRPGVGFRIKDIAPMTEYLADLGVEMEPNNPLFALMDHETGCFPGELLSERILSAILEIRVCPEEFETILKGILKKGKTLNTVFSLSVISRFEKNGDLPILGRLKNLGISAKPNAKINLGMGRPAAHDQIE